MSAEGLQDSADDPGVRLLAAAVRNIDPRELLLVHSGPLPGLRPGATRLILDVRERSSDATCVPATRFGARMDVPAALAEPRFAAAVVWPRAHLGKDFSEACLALGALALRPGGRLYCAVRKNKGGPSLARVMTALCGDVEVLERDLGYFLYMSEKPARFDVDAARAYLAVEYEIADPLLGPAPLLAVPGVFCRKHLDDGTRALLLELERQDVLGDRPPRQVLDLGAGVGPLGLWAARRWPEARVLAVESNLLAVELVAENAARLGCGPRVSVLASDGLPGERPAARPPRPRPGQPADPRRARGLRPPDRSAARRGCARARPRGSSSTAPPCSPRCSAAAAPSSSPTRCPASASSARPGRKVE
jgi:hypothetical protein